MRTCECGVKSGKAAKNPSSMVSVCSSSECNSFMDNIPCAHCFEAKRPTEIF